MEQVLIYTGTLTWIIFIVYVILRIFFGKNWMFKTGANTFLGPGLMSASKKLVGEIRNKNLKDDTVAEVGVHIFWRLTRIGILAMIIAMIPFILLFQQNKLISKQNLKFDVQNERIDIQNNLIEAERRSSLVFLMSNILDKVGEEIANQELQHDSIGYSLSQPLRGRIIALSRAFRHYRTLEGDTLSREFVSPERGQLFISLMESNLDSLTQNTIVSKGDFSNAIIGEINLSDAKLQVAKLQGADLQEAKLQGADLQFAKLQGADLQWVDLQGANLQAVDLQGANLQGAQLIEANLHGAQLKGANLQRVNLRRADLQKANLQKVDFIFVLGLKKEQLIKAYSLYQCKNLDTKLEAQLKKEKPCLFTEDGCND